MLTTLLRPLPATLPSPPPAPLTVEDVCVSEGGGGHGLLLCAGFVLAEASSGE